MKSEVKNKQAPAYNGACMLLIFIQSSFSTSRGLKAFSALFLLRFLMLFIICVTLSFQAETKMSVEDGSFTSTGIDELVNSEEM